MKQSQEVNKFLSEISSQDNLVPLVELIYDDLKKCSVDITNKVLQNKIQFEGSWSSYITTDVNVIYEEDMLRVNDLLVMYGIRGFLPNLKGDDIALILNYKFDLFDVYGNVMDTANVFHISIKGAIGEDDTINRWFLLYDI